MQKNKNKSVKLFSTFLLLGSLLWCSGCTKEQSFSENEEQKIVNLSMNLATRSGTGDAEIKNVRIIAFDSYNGGLVYNERIDNPSSNPITIQLLSGVRDIYVITNEPAGQSSRLANVRNLIELKEVRMPIEDLKQGETFVTFGQALRQTIHSKGASNRVEVLNRRLAIKVDLTVNGKGFTQTNNVSFTNLPDAVPLFEDDYESVQKKTITADLTDTGISPAGYIWSKTATIVLPSYLFTPPSDEDKAARVEFMLGSGVISAAIGHDVLAEEYTLHRNTIYALAAEIGPDNLVINASVRNWDENTANYPAGGGSFWNAQPQDTRVGLNGTTEDATAVFTAGLSSSGEAANFKWYRKKQLADFSFETTEITNGISSSPETNKSQLTIVASSLDDACEVYCVATVTAPDGKTDRLESERATFMVVGDWVQPAGTYPSMENWKAPMNVPLGSTCLLQDDRKGENKVYRVKLMADGNWWMIQDLSYGNASTQDAFDLYGLRNTIPLKSNALNSDIPLYGLAKETGLVTGGKYYNAHAALQLPGLEADGDNGSLPYTSLQSLCPDGWHLPGNMDGKFNEEWAILKNEGVDTNSFLNFKYTSPVDFNAYTESVSEGTYIFHGGYRAGKMGLGGFVYLTLPSGILYGSFNVAIDSGDRILIGYGVPIRCVRNFK